ncbi:DNA sulfur modification protein DndB [Novipirellula caenicola]|uniref:DNA sulfur modification protein DndB n=1 Tax=Novipirellula caenicola TaxID=1536901 RepID=A0ABP9VVG0_9BACT
MPSFEYVFPSIRGIQAGREYYISMCPMRLIPRIFLFDEEELRPELRSQRTLNKQRIPDITRYILQNPQEYTFSAITASIDGKVNFEPIGDEGDGRDMGRLHIPMSAKFVINDGQHRRAAIEAALFENPEMGDETISVVFFMDLGLKRTQQMFADLNRYAVRPTMSIGILYDHRDESSMISKTIVQRVPVFNDLCELEKATISNRSIKLFTLSGVHSATQALLSGSEIEDVDDKIELACNFWCEVADKIPDWELARRREVSAADLRSDFIHAHSLALSALARAGKGLLAKHPTNWKSKLEPLLKIDWSRTNTKLWEGRAMVAGRLSKKNVNVALTANVLKKQLGLALTAEENEMEKRYKSNSNGK